MTLHDWAENAREYYEEMPRWNATRASALSFWLGIARRTGPLAPDHGESVWNREWDVLILLDACRPDVIEEFSNEYEFIPDTSPTLYSRASWSREWLKETFNDEHREETARTAYVTGNVFTRDCGSDGILPKSGFGGLDEVWRDGWDPDHGTVPPETVTERAVDTWRDRPGAVDSMVVHYMQPHVPYRSLDIEGHPDPSMCREEMRRTVWDLLQAGLLSRDEALEAYRDNLRWALDHVETLLDNVEAPRVAISADHAELFGEFGLFSHPNVPLPTLRRVPWIETSATDHETLSPAVDREGADPDPDAMERRLKALGYK